jgi:hypothetical protein
MQKASLLPFLLIANLLALLIGCSSPTPTSTTTYQWVAQYSDNFNGDNFKGYIYWQWSDTSILKQDTLAQEIRSVGNAVGALLQNGMRWNWMAASPIRVSMDVKLSSILSDAAAVTVLDSGFNRRYWLVAGNNGIGQSATGLLSIIITDAGNGQTIISQAQQTIRNLSANIYYRLVLTLDNTKVSGEIQQSGSTLTQIQIQSRSISTDVLSPGVDLVGTASLPVYTRAFQFENYQTIYSGGGGGSCPLVYSFDGKRYYRESETFAGSLFKAAERAEYDRLYMLKAINGKCLLRIANELPEDHFINQVALVTVDAPREIGPIFDPHGAPHSLSMPVNPRFCTDFTGKDVHDLIVNHDSLIWESDMSARNFADPAAERDGLFLTFDKPSGARNMKLVIDGINTYLEFFTMELAFRHMGSMRKTLYDELEKNPKRQDELISLMNKEAGLHISLWRDGKWKECAALRDVGPLIQKQQIAIIDVRDLNDGSVKIKLESATDLWRINRVYADFSPDVPMAIHESAPDAANDQTSRDIRGLLVFDDTLYYKNQMGEYASVVFNDVPKASGCDRYYFVKAKGYYHNWLNTLEQKRVLSWNEILFGPDLNGKKFWDSWIKAKSSYQ